MSERQSGGRSVDVGGDPTPRTPSWNTHWLALLFGGAVAATLLWAGEFTLRVARPDPGLVAIEEAEAKGRPFDSRSRTQVVADLRAAGVSAVPRLAPAQMLEEQRDGDYHSMIKIDGLEILPLAGISNKTTVLCNETGDYAKFESDEHGFRNPPGSWNTGPVELVLVGDSFTIGSCVAPGETIADRLRLDWPKTVNLGYSGNSPLMELGTLVEFGAALEPRVTLWIFFENDLSWFDLGKSAKSPILMGYLENGFSQSLATRQQEIDLRLTALLEKQISQSDEAGPVAKLEAARPGFRKRWTNFLLLQRTRRMLALLRRTPARPRDQPHYELFKAILRRAQEQTAEWQGEIVVVGLPGSWNFAPHDWPPSWSSPDALDRVRTQAESLGLRFIDVRRPMEAHPDPLSLYSFRGESVIGSPHFNAAGYAFTAEIVREALRDRPPARP